MISLSWRRNQWVMARLKLRQEWPVRSCTYIVRTSPTFILHQSINHSYHTFHRVMSPDRRAYSLMKHFHYTYCILAFVDLTYGDRLQVCCPPPVAANDKMQRGLVTNTNDPSTSNQMLFDTFQYSGWWNDSPMLTVICPAPHYCDVHDVNSDA